MDTFIAWVVILFAVVIGILMIFGFIAAIFIEAEPRAIPAKQSRGGLGKVLVAGILLGMWLDDDE